MIATHVGRTSTRAMLWSAALGVLSACGGTGGDDPGESEVGSVVITQWNDSTELFLEDPHVVAGEATGNWAIHLTDMDDFKPIRSGKLWVRFMEGSTVSQEFVIEDVARDGIFLLDPVVERPGTYRVELQLESAQVDSRHVLPEVRVFGSAAVAPHAAEEEGGGIGFLKEQQWKIPFAVEPAMQGSVQQTSEAAAQLVAPDGRLVEVTAPVDGIALARDNQAAPSVGEHVRAGQVLVILAPTAEDGGFSEVRARVERLEREAARAERLYAAGAIAGKRLEEARHDLDVALSQASSMGAGPGGGYSLRLTSPIDGVVASRTFTPGGRVAAGTPLFTIVDPSVAWLRARVPVADAASIPAEATAYFRVEGSDAVHETGPLVSVGRVVDPRTRTVPVVFDEACEPPHTFGQVARAFIPIAGAETGVVIPNSAILDDNGTPVAYVQAGGETFERRVLIPGATDGIRTRVSSGIAAGEMVVTTGAYELRLASLSGDEFAGGHAH